MDATAVTERIGVDYGGLLGNEKGKTVAQFGYWKKANGEIVVKPTWPVEFVRQVNKGMQPLSRYGTFLDDDPSIKPDQFKRILAMGGQHEFGPRQVLEVLVKRYRHPVTGEIDRDRLTADFPQVQAVEWRDLACRACTWRVVDCPEIGLNGRHDLHKHETVSHKEVAQQQGMAREIAAATSGSNDALAKALGLIAEAIGTLGQRLDRLENKK